MKILTIVAALTLSGGAFAKATAPTVIYGEDDRLETFESDAFMQELALPSAGMFKTSTGLKIGDYTILSPRTLEDRMGLCPVENFAKQTSAVVCSGFLVAPDLMATAGHCARTQEDCERVSWVFDYKIDEKTGRAPVMVSNKKIFNCKEVVEAKLAFTKDGRRIDYALLRLDRKVDNRTPLNYRSEGKIQLGTELTVIGHPSGLPQKVAGGAIAQKNSAENYFQTNLDTFGGNSGSAVFDNATGEVEGILVRGAKDYERSAGGCVTVHKSSDQIKDFTKYGESVTRITDIKTLKFRDKMLAAAREGDLEEFARLAKEAPEANAYDNQMNTALHLAAKNNHVDILEYLIKKKADLNAQNERGETPLHVAAFTNAREAIV
ncbi:MAG: trypsin-like peptidase domain-containing protein, partial [Bacteriovoracaceae bacterium]